MVKIRAFRATDNMELCQRFIDGHTRVLEAVGVKKVTSSKHDWAYNPASFVILVEDDDETKVLGGARLQAADRKTPLPIEEAAGFMDEKVYELVRNLSRNGTGEVCGLWNSVEVAGLGIGSIFLIRAALALSEQIGLSSMMALCSPYTTRIAGNYGFLKEDSVGNEGTFYYPKLDLFATVVVQNNARELANATDLETSRIFDLRQNPIQIANEIGRKNQIIPINYDLQLNIENQNAYKF
jgi:hypothetical protein